MVPLVLLAPVDFPARVFVLEVQVVEMRFRFLFRPVSMSLSTLLH